MIRLVALALILLTTTAALPEAGTCGPWVSNANGTEWRMCADQQNQIYCELKMGRKIGRFVCPE
jgi:hypothetical protein